MYVSNKAIAVNASGRVLMMRLKNGKDDLPGGRMDAGEGIQEGLRRELREEIGVDVDTSGLQPFHAARRHYGSMDEWVACLAFVVPVGDIDVTLSPEHVGFDWIDAWTTTSNVPEIEEVMEAYRKIAR